MNARERRNAIAGRLAGGSAPLSATTLANEYGVSRQIIVGDIALLRAAGAEISATPRGYVAVQPTRGVRRSVACVHSGEDMERELCIIVDQGGEAVDVVVEHPVYGEITGPLHIRSRYDVGEFLHRVREEGASPLSALTGGIHLHTLKAPDEETMERVVEELDRAGFLLKESL
ncbi:MAG: transcription repressor NadR [Oscillospiraceae bacterium]